MQEHQTLIEQLIPLLKEDNFDVLFIQLCKELPKSERFLLKMEMNRLNQETLQCIDLRSKTTDKCYEVSLGGTRHFLPLTAKADLEAQIKLYGDRLTVGGVEHLMAHTKLNTDPTPEKKKNTREPTQVMGYYVTRREKRLTFVTNVTIRQADFEPWPALTSDLSVSGCRIRADYSIRFQPNLPLTIEFSSLAKEFIAPKISRGITYEIIDVEQKRGFQFVRLRRASECAEEKDELSRVLRSSSLRTVPDIEHILSTIQTHGYERHYLARMTALPIAFRKVSQSLQPAFSLQNRCNQSIITQWQDERGICQISAALSNLRLAKLLKEPEDKDHNLLYSFSHTQRGQTLFFSATLAELKHNNLVDAFFSFAALKPSFQVYQVSIHKVSPSDRKRAMICPIWGHASTPLVSKQLSGITVMALVECVTPIHNKAQYQERETQGNPNELRRFGLTRIAEDPIRAMSIDTEYRSETRYGMQTPAFIQSSQGVLAAMTDDLSPRGMKLKLTEPVNLKQGELLSLELPKLQPLAGKVKLKDIPYRLVAQQDNQLDIHLNIPEESEHPAIRFLAKMLIKNSSKLVKVSSSRQHRQLIDGLKVLTFQSFFAMPVFVHKEGKHVTLDLIGRSNGPDQVLAKLTANGQPEDTSIKWLARQLELNDHLKEIVDGVTSEDEVDIECLVRLPVPGLPGEVHRSDQFSSEQSRKEFAEDAIEQMRFAAMRLRLFRSDSPDIEYLKHDMNAVTSHAIHRGRDIEKLLWQVVMCGQLIDITEEFMMRYKLVAKEPPLDAPEDINLEPH